MFTKYKNIFFALVLVMAFAVYYYFDATDFGFVSEYVVKEGDVYTTNFQALHKKFGYDQVYIDIISRRNLPDFDLVLQEQKLNDYISQNNLDYIESAYLKRRFYDNLYEVVNPKTFVRKYEKEIINGLALLAEDNRLPNDFRAELLYLLSLRVSANLVTADENLKMLEDIIYYKLMFSNVKNTSFDRARALSDAAYTLHKNFRFGAWYIYLTRIDYESVVLQTEKQMLLSILQREIAYLSPYARNNFEMFKLNAEDFDINKLAMYFSVTSKMEKEGMYVIGSDDISPNEMADFLASKETLDKVGSDKYAFTGLTLAQHYVNEDINKAKSYFKYSELIPDFNLIKFYLLNGSENFTSYQILSAEKK